MTKPEIITSPSGDRLAVIPLAEYERLLAAVEDATDARLIDDVTRRLASGEDEMLPAEMVERMIAGESKVRLWREHRGLTGKALAAKAGMGAAYLSQIETGDRQGPVALMRKLADALGVTIDDLV